MLVFSELLAVEVTIEDLQMLVVNELLAGKVTIVESVDARS